MVQYFEKYSGEQKLPFDVKFAISICEKTDSHEALVLLYPLIGYYEEAVTAALGVSVELAKSVAKKLDALRPHKIDTDTCRRIWFEIAKHVINAEQGQHSGISLALEIVNDCDRLVRIEDLLPFFSDAVTIDQFKDAILSSLQDYKERVAKEREDLEHCALAAEQMSRDAAALKQTRVIVSGTERCYACKTPLYLREFYAFPCAHHIHRACAVNMAALVLPPGLAKRVADSYKIFCDNPSNAIAEQLDRILAADCPLCGDCAVASIDMPFFKTEQALAINSSWL